MDFICSICYSRDCTLSFWFHYVIFNVTSYSTKYCFVFKLRKRRENQLKVKRNWMPQTISRGQLFQMNIYIVFALLFSIGKTGGGKGNCSIARENHLQNARARELSGPFLVMQRTGRILMECTFIASFDAVHQRCGRGSVCIHGQLLLKVGHLSGNLGDLLKGCSRLWLLLMMLCMMMCMMGMMLLQRVRISGRCKCTRLWCLSLWRFQLQRSQWMWRQKHWIYWVCVWIECGEW